MKRSVFKRTAGDGAVSIALPFFLREFTEVLIVMKAEREQVLLFRDEDERNRQCVILRDLLAVLAVFRNDVGAVDDDEHLIIIRVDIRMGRFLFVEGFAQEVGRDVQALTEPAEFLFGGSYTLIQQPGSGLSMVSSAPWFDR